MSNRAPIGGDDAIREQFNKADTDASFGYLSVNINLDAQKFELGTYGTRGDNEDDDALFKKIVSECKAQTHAYFIVRDPTQKSNSNHAPNSDELKQNDNGDSKKSLNMYTLIHFAPDLSPVKQRMLYASSRPSLKVFLGASAFTQDYHCSDIADLTFKQIVDERTLHHRIDFRSDAEMEKEQAALESVPTSASAQVMASLPIEVLDSAKDAIEKYKSEECKCVFLTLDADSQKIQGTAQSVTKIADICALLSEDAPKYILFWYEKSKKDGSAEEEEKEQLGNKRIFGYFCPDKADRKLRFVYSTCKTNVIEYCSSVELEFYSKVEMSSIGDLNADYLDYHIFPVSDKKEQFKLPKGPKGASKKAKGKRKKVDVDSL